MQDVLFGNITGTWLMVEYEGFVQEHGLLFAVCIDLGLTPF